MRCRLMELRCLSGLAPVVMMGLTLAGPVQAQEGPLALPVSPLLKQLPEGRAWVIGVVARPSPREEWEFMMQRMEVDMLAALRAQPMVKSAFTLNDEQKRLHVPDMEIAKDAAIHGIDYLVVMRLAPSRRGEPEANFVLLDGRGVELTGFSESYAAMSGEMPLVPEPRDPVSTENLLWLKNNPARVLLDGGVFLGLVLAGPLPLMAAVLVGTAAFVALGQSMSMRNSSSSVSQPRAGEMLQWVSLGALPLIPLLVMLAPVPPLAAVVWLIFRYGTREQFFEFSEFILRVGAHVASFFLPTVTLHDEKPAQDDSAAQPAP